MKIIQILLLQATCGIILIATTYATTTEARQQRKADESTQVAVPTRSLKFGEKIAINIPSENEVVLSTPTNSNRNNGNIPAQRQKTRNRPQIREERITLPTQIPTNRRTSVKNQLVSQQQKQHDIPIVHKNRELFNKSITPTVGQQQENSQQQRKQNSNRSRFSNTTVKSQQTTEISMQHNRQQQRQRKPTTTTSTEPSTINNQPPFASRNANHNRTKQSSIAIHHRSSSNSNNLQPLLTGASAGGNQPKIGTSNNKQRSNTNENQSVSNTNTSIRSNTRKFSSTSIVSTTTSKALSSLTTTTTRPPFQFPSTFNIFTPEFWQNFLPPTSPPPKAMTTTKKPPKKYKPADPTSVKEDKLYSKHKTTISPQQPERIINNSPKQIDGPFRIALPTFNILGTRRETGNVSEKDKRDADEENLRNRFNCPRESEVRFQLFPKICKIDEDCEVWNRDELCCEIFGAKSCVSGIPKPLEETSHSPILGVIQRKCPSRPLAELWWEVKECETDTDCWPRVCCPDGRRRYCRTSQPELNTVPVPYRNI